MVKSKILSIYSFIECLNMPHYLVIKTQKSNSARLRRPCALSGRQVSPVQPAKHCVAQGLEGSKEGTRRGNTRAKI